MELGESDITTLYELAQALGVSHVDLVTPADDV
ncbi:hypothetical protein FHT91_006307 [Rhizobium sp. BK347]|nr:hypothetical protein [Rhizobium sp. BK252]MBB3406022.1 hypothetical protein [Rhizobium sp. BK289]MBB3418605.1 hypothetical protein [Rhizobium sp. BK284]MBB3486483.1 hypothetical protein [Rhizobium sp. BK347]